MGHLRVYDILMSEQEEGKSGGGKFAMEEGEYGCRSIDCMTTTPRATVSRWVSSLRKLGEKIAGGRREKIGCGDLSTRRPMNCSIGEIAVGDRGTENFEVGEESGDYRKDTTFNLGVGFGMAFFVAASKNELDKMTELRTQMEILLRNVKEEWQGKEVVSKQYQTMSSRVAYSTTDIEESWNSNAQISHSNYTPPESIPCLENVVVHDRQSICGRSERENCVLHGINQLEAELEAELQRLELHLSTECSPGHPQQQMVLEAAENSVSGGSPSSRLGVVIEYHNNVFSGDQNGVPPVVLERRLHELIETRQEERIKELEAALEQVRQKLIEKEKEVSWWRDTAQVISQHVPVPPRLTTQHTAEASRLSN